MFLLGRSEIPQMDSHFESGIRKFEDQSVESGCFRVDPENRDPISSRPISLNVSGSPPTVGLQYSWSWSAPFGRLISQKMSLTTGGRTGSSINRRLYPQETVAEIGVCVEPLIRRCFDPPERLVSVFIRRGKTVFWSQAVGRSEDDGV